MLEKVTVAQRIEIDVNTGLTYLVFNRCIVDTETGELEGSPQPHRVPLEPGEDYSSKMAMVNEAIVRDLKAAPIDQSQIDKMQKFVDFAHDKETVNNWQTLKAKILSDQEITPKA